MKELIIGLSLIGMFMFTASTCSVSSSDVEVRYVLVRHAEKLDNSADPPLTEAGKQWADALAQYLAPLKVTAVYASEFERTNATARPTAQAQKRPIMAYDPRDLPAFWTRLQAQKHQGTVLVVGHSNTTPALANLMIGEERYPKIDESDYGDVFVVTVRRDGSLDAVQYESVAAAVAATDAAQ